MIDRVILTSLKEERQNKFNEWEEHILNKNWTNCDTYPILLLHTLSKDSEHRLNLSQWYEKLIYDYTQEMKLLDDTLNTIQNPLQREQLKNKIIDLDKWKAIESHDRFLQTFKKEKLIDE